jgi:O-antigen/teichoic acid export membrane protein
MAQSFRFGWPLLANGVLLFLVFNGEKLIVGRELGMEQLAIFAMGITLTLTPTLVMAKSMQSFFLPQLSAVHSGAPAGQDFGSLARATVQASLLVGTVLVVAVLIFGDPLVHLLLGPKYSGLTAVLTGLAVVQALRVFKSGSSIAALACGQTGNAVIANLLRVALLPVAWLVLHQGGGLTEVIWIAIAGEAIGFAVSLLLVRYRIGVAMRPLILSLLITTAIVGLAAAHFARHSDIMLQQSLNWGISGLSILMSAALVLSMRDLLLYVKRQLTTTFPE